MTELDQYALETSWSTRVTDSIIMNSVQGDLPISMEFAILAKIEEINTGKVENSEIFTKFLSLILKEKAAKPIQAIATQIGHLAGIKESPEAFEWGLTLVKNCRNAGLYELTKVEDEWYVDPAFILDKRTKQKLDKLQYLPPMQTKPVDWIDNHNVGCLRIRILKSYTDSFPLVGQSLNINVSTTNNSSFPSSCCSTT